MIWSKSVLPEVIYKSHKTGYSHCSRCSKKKVVRDFAICRSRKNGLQPICKDCHNIKKFVRRKANSFKWNNKTSFEIYKIHKFRRFKCCRCNEIKNHTSFRIKRTAKFGISNECKSCEKIYNIRRRARKTLSKCDLTSKDIKFLHEVMPSCLKCNSEDNLHIDHITPLSLGGDTSLDNSQVLCRSCNCSKGNRDDTDYRSNEIKLKIKRYKEMKNESTFE